MMYKHVEDNLSISKKNAARQYVALELAHALTSRLQTQQT